MGIRFTCPQGHRLHVKSFLAGKRGICPHCGARFDIPLTDTGRVDAVFAPRHQSRRLQPGSSAIAIAQGITTSVPAVNGELSSAATATADAPAESEAASWYVRPTSGGQYGPIDDQLVRQWIRESRLAADSLVWRDDWPDWRRASDVFAELAQPATVSAATPDGPLSLSLFDEELAPASLPAGPTGVTPAYRASFSSVRTSQGPGKRAKWMIWLLGLIVVLLAVALVLVVLYFGNG